MPPCFGRCAFEELVPFGSERNKCPFGFDTDCLICKFYKGK